MDDLIDRIKKIAAFATDTVRAYEELKAQKGSSPDAKTLLTPLLYKHAVDYNNTHKVVEPALLNVAGPVLAGQYKCLPDFFHVQEGLQSMSNFVTQLSPYLKDSADAAPEQPIATPEAKP